LTIADRFKNLLHFVQIDRIKELIQRLAKSIEEDPHASMLQMPILEVF
jgi:hypothetical protein